MTSHLFLVWVRAGAVAALALFASYQAHGAVGCGFNLYEANVVSSGTPAAGWTFRTTYDLRATPGGVEFKDHFTFIGSWVAVGTACGAGVNFVTMPVGEYNAMINSAAVVTKLQEGYDMGVIALVIIALLVGFWFGWKAVQRGNSQ